MDCPNTGVAILLVSVGLVVANQQSQDDGDVIRACDDTPSGGFPPLTFALDHFTCYHAEGPDIPLQVGLGDQFFDEYIWVVQAVMLCNPAIKHHCTDTVDVTQFETHLVCYSLDADPTYFSPVEVTTDNQFGPERLVTRSTELLCLPSLKELAP